MKLYIRSFAKIKTLTKISEFTVYRGSYMSVPVLLNLLNELRKSDKMPGKRSILSLFPNKFNRLNNTGA